MCIYMCIYESVLIFSRKAFPISQLPILSSNDSAFSTCKTKTFRKFVVYTSLNRNLLSDFAIDNGYTKDRYYVIIESMLCLLFSNV